MVFYKTRVKSKVLRVWTYHLSESFSALFFSRLTADAPHSGQALLTGRDMHTSARQRSSGTKWLYVNWLESMWRKSQSVGVWDVSSLFFGGLMTSAGISLLSFKMLYLNFRHSQINSSVFWTFDSPVSSWYRYSARILISLSPFSLKLWSDLGGTATGSKILKALRMGRLSLKREAILSCRAWTYFEVRFLRSVSSCAVRGVNPL